MERGVALSFGRPVKVRRIPFSRASGDPVRAFRTGGPAAPVDARVAWGQPAVWGGVEIGAAEPPAAAKSFGWATLDAWTAAACGWTRPGDRRQAAAEARQVGVRAFADDTGRQVALKVVARSANGVRQRVYPESRALAVSPADSERRAEPLAPAHRQGVQAVIPSGSPGPRLCSENGRVPDN